jgi:hypothetical protein
MQVQVVHTLSHLTVMLSEADTKSAALQQPQVMVAMLLLHVVELGI